MKSMNTLLKLSLVLIISAVALPMFATKVWVENKTDKKLKVRFTGSGIPGAVNPVRKVGAEKVAWGDNIFGTKLEEFSLDDHEVKVPEKDQKGTHWYIYVQKMPFDLTKFTLYRVNKDEVDLMHGGTLVLRIMNDIFSLGLTEIIWTSEDAKDIKRAAQKALTYVLSGLIDKQGKVFLTYDEKYLINGLSVPLQVTVTTTGGKKMSTEIPAQQYSWLGSPEKIISITGKSGSFSGEFTINTEQLKSGLMFAVMNGAPYQVVSLESKNIDDLDLLGRAEKKVSDWVKKTTPETARSMIYKYFINGSDKSLEVKMSVAEAKDQTITIAPKQVDMIASAGKKVTSIVFSQDGNEVTVDAETAEKQPGFYITDLAKKDGIVFIQGKMSLKANAFVFELLKYK